MSPDQAAIVTIGAFAGGFVSGLAGFGTALVTVGIWLHALEPATATALSLICSCVAQAQTIPEIVREIKPARVLPFVVPGLLGVPLGVWALGTNGDTQIQIALTNVNHLLVGVNTNLDELTREIGFTLINAASITSNLNVQVRANSNLLGGISQSVMDADDLMQGLKRHWLLRSAFKEKPTNAPPSSTKPADNSSPYTGRKP